MELAIQRFETALIEQLQSDQRIRGVICVRQSTELDPLTDLFDFVTLILTETTQNHDSHVHYIKDGCRIQERWMEQSEFIENLQMDLYGRLGQLFMQGAILLDRDGMLQRQKWKIRKDTAFASEKLLEQFALFMQEYSKSRYYLLEGFLLDAYQHTLNTLNYWAKIVIIEAAEVPGETVWKQVRKINPGVYKLFEELTLNQETLEQRIQLVLLACEFSVMSKIRKCSGKLLRVLEQSEAGLTMEELLREPYFREIEDELPLLLRKLCDKSILIESELKDSLESSTGVLKYFVKT